MHNTTRRFQVNDETPPSGENKRSTPNVPDRKKMHIHDSMNTMSTSVKRGLLLELHFVEERHCSYYLGRHNSARDVTLCDKIHTLCFQAIDRSTR